MLARGELGRDMQYCRVMLCLAAPAPICLSQSRAAVKLVWVAAMSTVCLSST